MIPFVDLDRLHDSMRPDLDAAFRRVVATSAFVGSGAVRDFESEFAAAHGRRGGAGCGSGTDALALALRALGVGEGDEVVVPSMTFVASAEAVVHAGATPVIADVDADTLLLSPGAVEQVRSSRTRVVMPVHLYGHVVPPESIRAWRGDGLLVVEDAAQAHLATSGGAMVGTEGHATCFSFYPGKNLGALGDGGMVLSDDEEVLADIRRLRDHGRSQKYLHDDVGWCSRLDGLQAEFLRAKLRRLEEWTESRRRLAERYCKLLEDETRVRLVPWQDGAVHHLLVVRVDATDRQRIQGGLRDAGVSTGIHYPVPLSGQPSMRAWWRRTPTAEAAAGEVLSLPMDPLMSITEVDTVVSLLLEVVKGAAA